MRSITLICYSLAAFLPLSVFAVPTAPTLGERALLDECSAYSQAGMRDCLAKKAENSQKVLRQAEEKAMSLLPKWDEDMQYISQAQAALTVSNKDFSKYRESQCKFQTALSGGGAGNTREIRRLACVAGLNQIRVEQLRDLLSDLTLK